MRKLLSIYFLVGLLLFTCLTITAQTQKKAITNTDVISMIKAGLPESTIILAIQQGPTDFDTSAQTLIQLKNEGVSSKIMDAMLQAGRPVAPAQQSTTPPKQQVNNPLALGQDLNTSVSPIGTVTLVDGAERIQMKYSSLNIRSNSMLGAVVNPFHKTRMRSALNGNHARYRITNTSPLFEVGLASDVNASDVVALVKLTPKSETREIETSRGGITGVSTGFRKQDIIPVSIEESQSTNNGTTKIYTVKAVTPLVPGEYALVVNAGVYYDFGVDANK